MPEAPRPPIVAALALAALAAGAGIAALELASDHQEARVVWAVFGPAVGWAFVGTGLYAWRHRPDNRIGVLMVLLGFCWFVFCLQASNSALVYTLAQLAGPLWGSVFLHIGVTFPTGRTDNGADRAMVAAGYLVFPLAFLPAFVFTAHTDPGNLLLIRDDPALADSFLIVGGLAYLALFVVVAVRGARRWRASTAFERLQLTPVYAFALTTFALVTVAQTFDNQGVWWAALITTALMPFAFLGGLLRSEIVSLDASLQESLEELRASRARIVEAADAERRRLERDLHDGAQSRLVALSLLLKVARKKSGEGDVAELLDRASEELATSLAELRELARGIHPAVLTDRGLEPALRTLADRAPVPVEIRTEIEERLPGSVESAAYFVASEALANVAKYARASEATVVVERVNGHVTVEVTDDGIGGADASRGSGLRGLSDRVAALDGKLQVESPQGEGTRLRAEIPVR